MSALRKPLTNKFPGQCDGCCQRVLAGEGRYEIIGSGYDRRSRIRCLPCVATGREGGRPDLPWEVHNDLGELLSDDPVDFITFVDGEWKVALTFAQVASVIAMAKGRYRA